MIDIVSTATAMTTQAQAMPTLTIASTRAVPAQANKDGTKEKGG